MERGPIRILANLGDEGVKIDLRERESLRMKSCDGVVLLAGQAAMPKMSFAILERAEN